MGFTAPRLSFDIGGTLIELREVFNNFEQWVKPKKAPFDPVFCVMNPTVKPVPKGTVLILAPFNFPLYLLLGPLVRCSRGASLINDKLQPNRNNLASIVGQASCSFPIRHRKYFAALDSHTLLICSSRFSDVVVFLGAKHAAKPEEI